MKTISYTRMRDELADVLEALRNGEQITVTQRGRPNMVLNANVAAKPAMDIFGVPTETSEPVHATPDSAKAASPDLDANIRQMHILQKQLDKSALRPLLNESQNNLMHDIHKQLEASGAYELVEQIRKSGVFELQKKLEATGVARELVEQMRKSGVFELQKQLDATGVARELVEQFEKFNAQSMQIAQRHVLSFEEALERTRAKHAKIIKALEDK